MSDNPIMTVRPTKKQREILSYIEHFIGEHGYSPSYREIMNGLDYNSVATVSLHINSLIRRGHLRKRDRSARSLEVVGHRDAADLPGSRADIEPGQEKWLIERVEAVFLRIEHTEEKAEEKAEEYAKELTEQVIEDITMLVRALRVLGMEAAATSFAPRLAAIRERADQAPQNMAEVSAEQEQK